MRDSGFLILFKFIQKKKHTKDFLNGKLYCNTFDYFSKLKSDDGMRNDKFEGHNLLLNSKTSDIEVILGEEKFLLNQENGFISLRTRLNKDKNDKMFCLYAFTIRQELSRKKFAVNSKMLAMGNYVAYIKDSNEFIKRVTNALDKRKVNYALNEVEYIDTNTYSGKWDKFKKPIKYKHQKEYRIVYRSDSKEPEYLNVGDLSDIVEIKTIDEFLNIKIDIQNKKAGSILETFKIKDIMQ